MSKFGSKEEIISEIQSLFTKMNSGDFHAEALETLVELTRELNERALILRYKAYEEKVFGVREVTPATEPEIEIPAVETPVPEIEITVPEENQLSFEQVEEEILAAENKIAEPVFGFDLFETDASPIFSPEIKSDSFSESQFNHAFSAPEEVEETIVPVTENIVSEPIVAVPEITSTTEPTEEVITPVYTTPVATEEVLPVTEEEIIPAPTETEAIATPAADAPDVFKHFQKSDNSVGSRLMSPKLHTLTGAFGLNEKLQCIRELFKGSSEAFNIAIEKLDQQSSFEDAKRYVAQIAQQNNWDIESNLTNEFLQKIERRFM